MPNWENYKKSNPYYPVKLFATNRRKWLIKWDHHSSGNEVSQDSLHIKMFSCLKRLKSYYTFLFRHMCLVYGSSKQVSDICLVSLDWKIIDLRPTNKFVCHQGQMFDNGQKMNDLNLTGNRVCWSSHLSQLSAQWVHLLVIIQTWMFNRIFQQSY